MGSATCQIIGPLQSNGQGVRRIHMSRCVLYPDGSRSALLANCFWGGLGYQGQNCPGTYWFVGIAARPKNQYVFDKLWFFGLQKTTWPIRHYGIPLVLPCSVGFRGRRGTAIRGSLVQRAALCSRVARAQLREGLSISRSLVKGEWGVYIYILLLPPGFQEWISFGSFCQSTKKSIQTWERTKKTKEKSGKKWKHKGEFEGRSRQKTPEVGF